MPQIDLALETVTPLFLGGADPRGDPELRPASFRGLLRFWFRALVTGVIGDGNLPTLREAEAAVFGDRGDPNGGLGCHGIQSTESRIGRKKPIPDAEKCHLTTFAIYETWKETYCLFFCELKRSFENRQKTG
jgi:hypothetical protein